MTFRSVLIAVVLAVVLVVAAFLLNRERPAIEQNQPTAELARATGKCAECHRRETSAIVQEFEHSKHAANGVTCLDCHRAVTGQQSIEHRAFSISKTLTAKNCAQCHVTEYEQYARSRHAAPAWAAVNGTAGMTPEQVAHGERFHPGWVNRAPMEIGVVEGPTATASGCDACHSIGRPNADGTFGTCTNCHSRHLASIALAREPTTCGQCHMGPDHSQIEIYTESKHGAIFAVQRDKMNLDAAPKKLRTSDMPVPTCSTCHLSGLEGMKVTHDPSERLSYFLFAAISDKRPNGERAQSEMKEVCLKCHARPQVDQYFASAERVLVDTNEKVKGALDLVAALRKEKLLTPAPFDEPIEFDAFDLWHYYGRTAKHGAFMGGADFVQWHGNYEIVRKRAELDHAAAELRARKAAKSGR